MIRLSHENTVRHAPVASRTILVACCLVFLWQLAAYPWGRLAGQALGFTPAWFLAGGPPQPWLSWVPFSVTLVSYSFLHAGWLHLGGNMAVLWVFGDDVEDALGQPGFIVFYLLSGMAAALAQALSHPGATVPMIGASGAVSGVLGAYLVLYPRAQMTLLAPASVVHVVRLPAFLVLAGWFLAQLLFGMASPDLGGGIAFRAHVGGFLFGALAAPVFVLVSGRRRAWRRLDAG